MQNLAEKRIIVGISSGIAAYKSAELVRILRKNGAIVRVVMTKNATNFIAPLTLQALSGNKVHLHLLDEQTESSMGHIELAKWCDLILIAPASANLIARIAHGLANDLLTTLILATNAPILIAPAMNQAMFSNAATCANLQILQQRNFKILGPNVGEQACGDVGLGRMLEPQEIAQYAANAFSKQTLNGKHVLITAGPTQESIDPVRYITNHSSGKMGFALAKAAKEAGANVTLITGPVHLPTPLGVKRVDVISAKEMLDACLAHLPCDILLAAAAVADYRPHLVQAQKIKKNAHSEDGLHLELVRNPDILATLAQRDDCLFKVGFAAETQNLLQFAAHKLKAKNLDLIIANDVANPEIGFNSDNNAVTIISKDLQQTHLAQNSKDKIAAQIIEFIGEKTC